MAMFAYINDKRSHAYTMGYDTATFATHALKAAGISAPSSLSSIRKNISKEMQREGNSLRTIGNDLKVKYRAGDDARLGAFAKEADELMMQDNYAAAKKVLDVAVSLMDAKNLDHSFNYTTICSQMSVCCQQLNDPAKANEFSNRATLAKSLTKSF